MIWLSASFWRALTPDWAVVITLGITVVMIIILIIMVSTFVITIVIMVIVLFYHYPEVAAKLSQAGPVRH